MKQRVLSRAGPTWTAYTVQRLHFPLYLINVTEVVTDYFKHLLKNALHQKSKQQIIHGSKSLDDTLNFENNIPIG